MSAYKSGDYGNYKKQHGVCLCACVHVTGVMTRRWERNYFPEFARPILVAGGIRRGSATVRWPELPVRIPPEARMSVPCDCCVLSGRGLCNGPNLGPEESYRL